MKRTKQSKPSKLKTIWNVTVLFTFNTEHESPLVLSKSYEKRTELKRGKICLIPLLSREDAMEDSLCLKKRRELINNDAQPDKLKKGVSKLFTVE